MDKIKIIREALESIEGAWIDAVPLEKINKALQALAELEQQEFEKKLTPDIKELMIEDYVRCMKKAGLQGSGKFLSSYFEQPTVNEELIKEIEQVRLEHANNQCTIDGCTKLKKICEIALSQVKPSFTYPHQEAAEKIQNEHNSWKLPPELKQ